MPAKFTYSRWDGSQRGFDIDAESLLGELADDLLYHGDVNSALRKLMQDGMRDINGDRIAGMREMMERLREKRESIQERGDLGGVYSEIANELNDVVDEERHAIENYTTEAKNSGDQRRAEMAEQSAMERNFRLDMLPADLAGKIAELQHYDFQSKQAQQRFEQLIEKLREQLMQQHLDQMSGEMQKLTPADMQRMKDMMAELNAMLERRQQGEDPKFEEFMKNFGDFFPENPETLDELLEIMAQRMAAAQAMLNSMTPEQRAQMQQLSEQLLEDMDLRWQMDQLSKNLQSMFPQAGWQKSYDFSGQDAVALVAHAVFQSTAQNAVVPAWIESRSAAVRQSCPPSLRATCQAENCDPSPTALPSLHVVDHLFSLLRWCSSRSRDVLRLRRRSVRLQFLNTLRQDLRVPELIHAFRAVVPSIHAYPQCGRRSCRAFHLAWPCATRC